MKHKAIYLLLTAFLFLNIPMVYGQKEIRSKKQAPESKKESSSLRYSKKEDADRVGPLLRQAEKASATEPKKALDFVAEALSLSINENDRSGEARSYQTLGNINYAQGLYSKAVENYQKSLEVFTAIGDNAWRYGKS